MGDIDSKFIRRQVLFLFAGERACGESSAEHTNKSERGVCSAGVPIRRQHTRLVCEFVLFTAVVARFRDLAESDFGVQFECVAASAHELKPVNVDCRRFCPVSSAAAVAHTSQQRRVKLSLRGLYWCCSRSSCALWFVPKRTWAHSLVVLTLPLESRRLSPPFVASPGFINTAARRTLRATSKLFQRKTFCWVVLIVAPILRPCVSFVEVVAARRQQDGEENPSESASEQRCSANAISVGRRDFWPHISRSAERSRPLRHTAPRVGTMSGAHDAAGSSAAISARE